ncbi:MAG: alpha-mannosidase, partial [Clostridiales bacterium]|nr:alpha-mannosidase [Clostridiales bacterium]
PIPGQPIHFVIKFYAGHYVIGCQPFERNSNHNNFTFPCGEIWICEKVQEVADFLYDLKVLIQLAKTLDTNSFRRADIMNTLFEVHKVLIYSPEEVTREEWLLSLKAAREKMLPALIKKNGDSAPTAVLTGHSHMDTAWLWPVSETIRKNARTLSNQMNLMEQYPEYRYLQSSALHSYMIEKNYPSIFEQMKKLIAEKRYEPNGGVWVECDCNIASGESLVRQFLWGQRYTKEKFDYLADCFWLPDTFGYSAAIPQIMKGFGIRYFLTTKLAWNDTNRFPYDTFIWEGIDKSQVLAHFFVMDTWVDPKSLLERINGINYNNGLKCKQACNERLVAFGYGDGGGGPTFEMIETARRLSDLEGCPKTRYQSVSDFMQHIEETYTNLPRYKGELYLELHRGTLTGKQQIKKNNRRSEIALHNLELLETIQSVQEGKVASDKNYRHLWEILLKNQFHDILPGTCISLAHDCSIKETNGLLEEASEIEKRYLHSEIQEEEFYSVLNTLGFSYKAIVEIDTNKKLIDPKGILKTQKITDMEGNTVLKVSGLELKPFAHTSIHLKESTDTDSSPFHYENNQLITPFAKVTFNQDGHIASFIDRRNGRELCEGIPFGSFASFEDVPAGWDGWDVDADSMKRLQVEKNRLLSREVVSDGEVEFRIRSHYKVCNHSTIIQDLIFYADSPLVEYDTKLLWRDKHQFLKAMFGTSICAQYAVHEIQFGNMKRPTTRNNSIEQAMFEVCCHKYMDLSEPSYGIAFLNDCKYGISVEDGTVGISLAKGGTRPDERGDMGDYRFRYGILPHMTGFQAQEVILPAYQFNYKPIVTQHSKRSSEPLLSINRGNLIIETIKPCEDAQKAFIARIYEAEGTYTKGELQTGFACSKIEYCDMMENPLSDYDGELIFQPFEIKNLKFTYDFNPT